MINIKPLEQKFPPEEEKNVYNQIGAQRGFHQY
jgi:hypothetical protein